MVNHLPRTHRHSSLDLNVSIRVGTNFMDGEVRRFVARAKQTRVRCRDLGGRGKWRLEYNVLQSIRSLLMA